MTCPKCGAEVMLAISPTGHFVRLAAKPHPEGHFALEFNGLRRPPRASLAAQGGHYIQHQCRLTRGLTR